MRLSLTHMKGGKLVVMRPVDLLFLFMDVKEVMKGVVMIQCWQVTIKVQATDVITIRGSFP